MHGNMIIERQGNWNYNNQQFAFCFSYLFIFTVCENFSEPGYLQFACVQAAAGLCSHLLHISLCSRKHLITLPCPDTAVTLIRTPWDGSRALYSFYEAEYSHTLLCIQMPTMQVFGLFRSWEFYDFKVHF